MAKSKTTVEPIKPDRPNHTRGTMFVESANLHTIIEGLESTKDEELIAARLKLTYEGVAPRVKKAYRDPFLAVLHHCVFKDGSPRRVSFYETYLLNKLPGHAKKSYIVLKDTPDDSNPLKCCGIGFHVANVARRARQGKVF